MADVTITIPLPVLVGSQRFYVRYRALPAGTWIVLSEQTNAPFVISGVAPGQYELEASLITGSPATLCPPDITPFTVPEDIDCLEFTAGFQHVNGVWTIRLSRSIPSPYIAACYYEVTYGIAPNLTTLTYTSFPTTSISLPASEDSYTVIVRAFDCDGNSVECYNEVIEPPVVECEHATLDFAEIYQIGEQYYINISMHPSVPASATYTITFYQYGTYTSGTGDPGGTYTVTVNGTDPEQFAFPINPNHNVAMENGSYFFHYDGTVADDCNYMTKFNANYEL